MWDAVAWRSAIRVDEGKGPAGRFSHRSYHVDGWAGEGRSGSIRFCSTHIRRTSGANLSRTGTVRRTVRSAA